MEFIKKISLKFKIVLVIITSVIGAMLFFYLRNNLKAKKYLEYRLDVVKKETELAELEKDEKVKKEKIKDLKQEEKEIIKNIEILEKKENKGEEISPDELEDFFKKRVK